MKCCARSGIVIAPLWHSATIRIEGPYRVAQLWLVHSWYGSASGMRVYCLGCLANLDAMYEFWLPIPQRGMCHA